MIKKHIPVGLIAENAELHADFAQYKLERQSAFMLGRGLSSQLEMLTGQGLNQFRLPQWLCVRKLEQGEQRLQMESGEWVIVNEETGEIRVQLPLSAIDYPFHILQHVCDRCAINCALVHYLMSDDYLTCVTFGPSHGIWSSVKNALKKSCTGRGWQAVLGFLLVNNMNYFPFQSSQGWRDKQFHFNEYLCSHDHTCSAFQEIKESFAMANGLPGKDNDEELFKRLACMRSFHEKGPLLKLQRWLSINECWKFLRPEVAGLKLILSRMLEAKDPNLEMAEMGTQQSMDADIMKAMQKPGGCVEKAHQWLDIPYNIFFLDMIDLATEPLRQIDSHLASTVKDPSQGL